MSYEFQRPFASGVFSQVRARGWFEGIRQLEEFEVDERALIENCSTHSFWPLKSEFRLFQAKQCVTVSTWLRQLSDRKDGQWAEQISLSECWLGRVGNWAIFEVLGAKDFLVGFRILVLTRKTLWAHQMIKQR